MITCFLCMYVLFRKAETLCALEDAKMCELA